MSISPDDWPRVRTVFEHALTLPVSARSDYLAAACAGRTGIQQQGGRMLTGHEQGAGFLERPGADHLTDAADTLDLEGAHIGPYQLGTRIGAGGVGEVYRARETRAGRHAATQAL